MKTQITAVELFYLNKEIQICSNAKIDNIFHPTQDQLVFRIYKKDHPKILLSIITPKYLYIAKTTPPTPPQPSAFCTYLRKHISGGWIESISQVGAERIVSMVVSKKGEQFNLFFEFFGRGNCIVTKKIEDEWIIQSATLYKTWNDREIKRHQAYQLPQQTTPFYQTSLDQLKKDIKNNSDGTLAKFLATQYGLGGPYAKEICLILDLKQNTPLHDLDDNVLPKLVEQIKSLSTQKVLPSLVKTNEDIKDITPFPLQIYKEQESFEGSTYSELFDRLLSDHILENIKEEQLGPHAAKVKKQEAIFKQQKIQFDKLQKDIVNNNANAEFLYAHYQQITKLLEHIGEMQKTMDSKTFKKTLEALPYIAQVDQKNKKVTLDIESLA